MATQDAFGQFVQGILEGHQLRMQLRDQQLREEAFQRRKVLEDNEASVKDIMDRMQLDKYTRPVNAAGMVDQPLPSIQMPGFRNEADRIPGAALDTGAAGQYGAFDVPMLNRMPDITGVGLQITLPGQLIPAQTAPRVADKSRIVRYKSRAGETQLRERLTQEEINANLARETEEQTVNEALAKRRATEDERRIHGVDIPSWITEPLGLPIGARARSGEELMGMAQKVAAIRREGRQSLAPGASMVDFSGPTPQTIFTAPDRPRQTTTNYHPSTNYETGDVVFSGVDANGNLKVVEGPRGVAKSRPRTASTTKAKQPGYNEIVQQLASQAIQDSIQGGGNGYEDAIRNVEQYYSDEPKFKLYRAGVLNYLKTLRAKDKLTRGNSFTEMKARLGGRGATGATTQGGGRAGKTGGKTANAADVAAYARTKGITEAKAREEFESYGYTVR